MTYSIEQVKKLVDERSAQDQLLRNQKPINWDEVNSYDEESYQLMKQLFSQFGAIDVVRFGEKASDNAWLLVQHCPHVDFMRQYLDVMLDNPEDFIPKNIAYLTDRVFMYEEKPQVYGTQLRGDFNSDTWYVYKTIEPKDVNQRRAIVGLGSIEEYCEGMDIDLTKFKG